MKTPPRAVSAMTSRNNAENARRRRAHISAKSVTVLVVVLITVLASAQTENSARGKKESTVYAELGKAPRKAVRRNNPLQNDPDAALAGGKLFELHCAECHGEMAEGGRKGPSLRADEVQRATPGTLFWLLTNGVVRRGMPVWSKLPEPQRWQLVRYIKSLTPPAMPIEEEKTSPPGGHKDEGSKPPGR
ncbi:MAG: cytochrome c [Candidatus Sulfotelmatobacter sp.]